VRVGLQAGDSRPARHRQRKHHDGDDDRYDTVGEGIQPVRVHSAPPRPVITKQPKRRRSAPLARTVRVWIDRRLRLYPLDQFVELDGLLRGGKAVFLRKSVLTGGLIRSAGGSG